MRHTLPPITANRVFERYIRRLLLARIRWATGLAATLVPLGFVLDLVYIEGLPLHLGGLRVLIGILFSLVYGATRVRGASKAAVPLGYLCTLIGTAGSMALTATSGGPSSLYYGSTHLVVLATGLLFPWSARHMAVSCAAVLVIFGMPDILHGTTGIKFLTESYLLLCSVAIAVLGALLGSQLRQRDFASRHTLKTQTRQLRATTAKLRALEQTRTEFYENISHELRTPLTLILAPLEIILQSNRSLSVATVKKELLIIHRNALVLRRLIDEIMQPQRIDPNPEGFSPVPTDVAALVSRLVAEFEPWTDSRAQTLVLNHSSGVGLAIVDPDQMETVFRNLISNAVKFTPRGGIIEVRLDCKDDRFIIEVIDSGVGIAPEDQERIFERFERVHGTETPGSGIGLALVRQLVLRNRGTITVQSRVRSGSCFRIEVPAVPLAADPQDAPVPSLPAALPDVALPTSSSPNLPRERVLVVEDHEQLSHFLCSILSEHFDVQTARNVNDGFTLALEQQPSVIVSDVMLPGDSGLSLLRKVRQHPQTSGIPVIFLTAVQSIEARLEGLDLGASDYVNKPFVPAELLARIRVQLRLRQLTARLAQTQKLTLLHTLSAGLAHEIRNPINAITNGVALLRKHWPTTGDESSIPTLLSVIEESSDRMAALIDDLLSFTEGQSQSLGIWNPVQAVESALRLLHPRLAEVKVHQSYHHHSHFAGNPARLSQVVLNLIDNALRAVIPKGEVWISTTVENSQFKLTVRDNGYGISAEQQAKIFDPFYTTRPINEGMGLGLHLCRAIARAHGGEIHCTSQSGQGAAFVLCLPTEGRSVQAA